MATAEALATDGRVSVYRAGLWKPRSEPGCFEGVGEKGLQWLRRVKAETGLQVTTEVARASHVKAALEAEVDVLWVGARSTTNPFTVQEIAEALEGADVPVMVKNPVSPDPRLWMGAVRRLKQAGIKDITLVHRGFTPFRPGPYRNEPRWEIPLQVRAEMEGVRLLCDPSHIAGRRAWVAPICHQAWELGFDGLMVETHVRPEEAWSDAKQQLRPLALSMLLDDLGNVDREPLETLRKEVDLLDQHLLELIAARMHVVKRIGGVKEELGMDVVQEGRWRQVLDRGLVRGNDLGLSGDFLTKYLEALHGESIAQQRGLGS